MKPGEISSVVESQFGYHVIKLEERRTQNDPQGKPVEQVHVRHIVIGYNPSGELTPKSPRNRAREAVELGKRERWIEGIVARRQIQVPDDFTVSPKAIPSAKP